MVRESQHYLMASMAIKPVKFLQRRPLNKTLDTLEDNSDTMNPALCGTAFHNTWEKQRQNEMWQRCHMKFKRI